MLDERLITAWWDSPILNKIIEEVFCKVEEENKMTRLERSIKKVIFNDPATIIIWSDGSKSVVKCGDFDTFDKEKGMAMAIVKHLMNNKGNFNELFKKYIPELN